MTTVSPADLLALAMRVAAEGAALAQVKRAEFIMEVRTKSTETDVVTAADDAVERCVIGALLAARPGDAILSEESGERPAGGRPTTPSSSLAESGSPMQLVRWILDPIDGTVNYLYGLPFYAVSLAASIDGVVVAGVVHNIPSGEVYTASLGGGAFVHAPTSRSPKSESPETGSPETGSPDNGRRRLTGSSVTELSQTLVATGFGYDASRRLHQAAVFAGLAGTVRDIRRLGSGALDLCLAAAGVVDAFYEKGLSEWDRAAGVLIAREAGLLVTGLNGHEPGSALTLAAPAAIHGQLHDMLAKLDASGGP